MAVAVGSSPMTSDKGRHLYLNTTFRGLMCNYYVYTTGAMSVQFSLVYNQSLLMEIDVDM